jgi:uncharacterized LabA/DUF88 family protein
LDRCALFVDANYALAEGALAVHGTRNRDSVSWDYAGLLKLLGGLSRERTGLQLLRCYWYDTASDSARAGEHDTLADIPGLKLRLTKSRPSRKEGVEAEIRKDLTALARNHAVSDVIIVSAEEDLAPVIAEVQDLGVRAILLHVATDGNWAASRTLRQESDDIIDIGPGHLRPYVDLIAGAEPQLAAVGYREIAVGAAQPSGPYPAIEAPAVRLYNSPVAADYQLAGVGPAQDQRQFGGHGETLNSGLVTASGDSQPHGQQLPGSGQSAGQPLYPQPLNPQPSMAQSSQAPSLQAQSSQAPSLQAQPAPAQQSVAQQSVAQQSVAQQPQGQPGQGQPGQGQPGQGQLPQGQLPQGQPGQGQLPQGQPGQGQPLQQYYQQGASRGQAATGAGAGFGQDGGFGGPDQRSQAAHQPSHPQAGGFDQPAGADNGRGQPGQNGQSAAIGLSSNGVGGGQQYGGFVPQNGVGSHQGGGLQGGGGHHAASGHQGGAGPQAGAGPASGLPALGSPNANGMPASANGMAASGTSGGQGGAAGGHGTGPQPIGGHSLPGMQANGLPGSHSGQSSAGGSNGLNSGHQLAAMPRNGMPGSAQNSGALPPAGEAYSRTGLGYGAGSQGRNGQGGPGPGEAPLSGGPPNGGQYQLGGQHQLGGQPPESGMGVTMQPPLGQPGQGQQQGPPLGQPPLGQPPLGQPPLGQPPHGQPPNSQPSRGQQAPGQMGQGQLGPGQLGQGQLGQGQPGPGAQQRGGPAMPSSMPPASLAPSPLPPNGMTALDVQRPPVQNRQLPPGNGAQYSQDRSMPYGGPVQPGQFGGPGGAAGYGPGSYGGQQAVAPPVTMSIGEAVQSAHAEGFGFGEAVARDAPALWLEAVLARKPRMPSDLEARLLQGSALPIDSLLHDEVRHALRRGFWDALERSRH